MEKSFKPSRTISYLELYGGGTLDIKTFVPIFVLLLGVGILFGTFENFATGTPFGWAWFVNMLWFVVGFPALLIIGTLLLVAAVIAIEKLKKEAED